MIALFGALAAASQAAPATPPAQKDPNPIICTRQNMGDEVGTRMQKKKVCMHKSDRDYIDQQEKQSVQQLINDGNDRMRFIPKPR